MIFRLPNLRTRACTAALCCALLLLTACASQPPAAPTIAPAPTGPAPSTPAPAASPASGAPTITSSAATPVSPPPAASIGEFTDANGSRLFGRADAPLTLTDFSDFLWGVCPLHVLETEPRIIESYVNSGRVKLRFRHLLDYGEPALLASQAAECAGDQGRFWDMRRLIYQRQRDVFNANADLFKKWATEDLKIDGSALGACIAANTHKAKIERSHAAARSTDGIRARPTFDINGKRLQGALPFAEFQKVIESFQ